jgi:hypothetical protein
MEIDMECKVTICPPCETLSRPQPRKKIWHAPQNGHDKEICAGCKNKGRCESPCSPLNWIDGNVPRRENFINEAMLKFNHPDYKDVLYDLSCHKNPQDRREDIKQITDIRIRAICAMLAVDIPKAEIASLLSISRVHLYRLLRPMLHPKKNEPETISQEYKNLM